MRALLMQLERLSGRPMPKRRVPAALALATGMASTWIADNVTHRPPIATREAVLLALRSAPFDSAKAARELGYAPRPIERALTDVVEGFKRKNGRPRHSLGQSFDKMP
jgi:dihydroflavonol-4-reductase